MASSKRERELARLRAQRQAARRAEREAARRKRRTNLLAGLSALVVAAVIVIIALATGGSKKASLTSSPSPSASAAASASASPTAAAVPGTCAYTKTGTAAKKVSGQPPLHGDKHDAKATITTNRGEIDVTMHGAKAPCTTGSFAFLAAQKYFDSTSCHRLTTSGIYVLQCGDPRGSGSGGPGYQFADENLTGLGKAGPSGSVVYPRGTVAMANAGPGTNGSQFFLVYKDSPLPPNYTPFGTITKGLDVLDTVAKAGSTPVGDGKPNSAVTITTFTVKD